ncbi:MAG: hypothetical protein EZS28_015226, partial [Streblomastix strix]
MFFLENLAIPGEITSAAVGHFQNLKQNLLILAKSTILSLYVYDSEQGKFHLLDHKHVFRQVLSIHTVPQHHSLDCLLVVSVNGEWLFLQWHENDFFPLASGSLMDAALRIMKNPEQRRFRINPTFQFSVLIIPQDEDSTTQISKPEKPQNFQQIIEKEIHNFDSVSNIINSDQKPIQRISLRAICFVDEVVCVGLSYDGPGSDLMYDISEKMDETLMNIPQMCGWGDGYSVTLDNGLEHIWRAKQKSKETVNETFAQKEKVVIAQAQTFIFFKEELNEIDGRNVLMLDTIHRVRHAAYTRNMHLPKFPFQCTQSEDHSFDNIASIYLIVDTPEGVCLSSFILNFANQTLKMGQFAVVGLPCSTSRIIILHDNQNHNSSQFCNELIQQNLIGSIPVNVQFINNVKGSNLFLALSGQQIKIASKEQRELIAAKKLQKLILSKRSKSKMISIHIKQNTLTPPLEGSPISEEFPSPSSSIQSSPSIQEIQSETCDYISHSFVPYILASSKAIILQQSINKAFVFPFPTTLQVPPFGFCHVYVEDRTELEQEQQQNSDQQIEQHQSPLISQQKDKTSKFVHKLLLGGGKDIITIQEGQIQQQHYETKCINDILIIQPKQNNPKPEKLKPKEQADKRIKHTTAVVTTSSGTPLLMHLDTGQIIEVGEEDDDFALPTGQIQYAINIPPKWENKQVQEDRMAFGVAHGITGTGELQLVSVGHKMKEIIKDNWICGNAKLFSSQQFAGRGIREFLLAQDETTHDSNEHDKSTQNTENDNHKEQTSSQNVIEPFTPKLPLSPPKSPTILVIRATPMRSKNSVGTFWKVPPWLTSDECKSIIEQRVKLDDVIQQISFNPLRQITIDHAAVGDNVIVVSHKSIVYILLWHPAIPIILSQKKQQASWNRATRLALIAYYSSQQNATNKVLNQIDRTISQVELTEQSQIKMQMHLQVVCTLKFSSNVDALAASTICGNQFIVVCTKDPNMARVFRLSNLENDIEFQKENQKLWELTNKHEFKYLNRNIFNQLRFPNPKPQVPPNEQFIEAQLGDNKFLLNFCCLQLTVTPIIDMKLNNPASSCLFTTLERSVKRLGPEEDVMPNEALFGMSMKSEQFEQNSHKRHIKTKQNINQTTQQPQTYGTLSASEKEEQYQAHEGALLLIGGQYGLAEFVVIPLAQLMLDVPPHRYSSAMDVLKIGMLSREQKLQNSVHELFTFPPESQFMDLGRSPVSIAEDNRRVIIKSERTFAVRFDPYLGRTVWLSLYNEQGIR